MLKTKDISSIYETPNCIALQLDSKSVFSLHFFGNDIELKPCSLISFRNKLQKINLEELFYSNNHHDLEIIKFGCIDRLFIFTLHELIELKAFLEGVFTMLELNSLIHARLVRF